MPVTPPFNPAAVFPNTAVAPFTPVGRGNPGTGPVERPAGTSFPPLDQPETAQGTQRDPARGENTSGQAEARAARAELSKLQQRDREVRAHEQAHKSVGGSHIGAAQLRYTRGPDGRLYASEGEVSINTAPIPGDPEATLIKAGIVRRAALAPADPSATDLRAAAEAARIEAEARRELRDQETEASEDAQLPDPSALQVNFLQRLIELGVIENPNQIRPGAVLDTLA